MEKLLIKLGFNISSKGFDYWLQAIKLWKTKGYKNYNLENLYNEIAENNNSSRDAVERALRSARMTATKNITKKYKYPNKLSNKSVLTLLCLGE